MGLVESVFVGGIVMRRGVLLLRSVMIDSHTNEEEHERCSEDWYTDVDVKLHGVKIEICGQRIFNSGFEVRIC